MTVYHASIYYRAEKPYGVGKTAHQRHMHIVSGWRGEIIGGLDDGLSIYTGACASKDEAVRELISHLKAQGLSGKLRLA